VGSVFISDIFLLVFRPLELLLQCILLPLTGLSGGVLPLENKHRTTS
jgi:hypothetical protein